MCVRVRITVVRSFVEHSTNCSTLVEHIDRNNTNSYEPVCEKQFFYMLYSVCVLLDAK